MSLAGMLDREVRPFGFIRPSLGARSTPTVFVLGNEASLRDVLVSRIHGFGWKAKTFASAEEFLSLPPVSGPSCLVLDVRLLRPGGRDFQRRVAVDRSGMPIILVTDAGDVLMTVRAVNGEIAEFVTTPCADDGLMSAIRGSIEWSEMSLRREADFRILRGRHETLSRREREVMALVVSGLLNKQIAGELGLSEITVKAHRGKVMRKMEAGSLADLVRKAACLRLALPADAPVNTH